MQSDLQRPPEGLVSALSILMLPGQAAPLALSAGRCNGERNGLETSGHFI
jgi:hypothetical protein